MRPAFLLRRMNSELECGVLTLQGVKDVFCSARAFSCLPNSLWHKASTFGELESYSHGLECFSDTNG